MEIETRTLEDVTQDLDGGLRNLYGGRYRGLVLYGSYARGEADKGSDVDLLLLLEDPVEVGREIRRSSGLASSLALESGLVLSLIPVSIEDYRVSSDPYLINARREGTVLSPTAERATPRKANSPLSALRYQHRMLPRSVAGSVSSLLSLPGYSKMDLR